MLGTPRLIYPDEAMCDASRDRSRGLPGARVVRSRCEDPVPHDCSVTAGNSSGIKTGKIGAPVVRFFGVPIMELVQYRILGESLGEQSGGTAFGLPTGHPVPGPRAEDACAGEYRGDRRGP